MRLVLFAPLVLAAVPLLRSVPDAPTDPHAARHPAEVARIRRHFDSVVVELRATAGPAWSAAQRARRNELIAVLERYRDAGAFPHNYDFPGQAVPYFVDRATGVRCAVAHLLDATGRGDIVRRVASMDNNVWVPQLAADTAFNGWLDAQGLTLAEAARIQVPYIDDGNTVLLASGSQARAYGIVTAAVAAPALATAWWNWKGNSDGHRSLGTTLGLAAGALALGVGVTATQVDGTPAYVAPVTLAAGGLGAWLSGRSLLRHRDEVAQARANPEREPARVSVAPLIPTRTQGAGLAFQLTF